MTQNPKGQRTNTERLNDFIEALLAERSLIEHRASNETEGGTFLIASLLKVAALPRISEPNPSFAKSLERRLRKRYREIHTPRTRPFARRTPRAGSYTRTVRVAAGSAILFFAALSLLILRIFEWGRPSPPMASLLSIVRTFGSLEPLPEAPGILGDVEFVLETTLPQTPKFLTVYEQGSAPTTLAQATELARRLGVQGPVYRTGNSFIAQDSDSTVQISALHQGYYDYRREVDLISPEELMEPQKAVQVAQAYVEERGLLDFDHGTPRLASEGPGARYQVHFPQTAGGIPIENAGVTVTVSGDGQVMEVSGRVLQLHPVGEMATITPQQAYRLLQKRDPFQVFLVRLNQFDQRHASQVVAMRVEDPRLPPPYSPGDYVSVKGLLQVSILGNPDAASPITRAWLLPQDCRQAPLSLTGSGLADLSSLHGFRIRAWGVAARANHGGPALILSGLERTQPEEEPIALVGRTMLDQSSGEASIVLETHAGDRYSLSSWCEDARMHATGGQEWIGTKVLVSGFLTGQRTARGDPIVRVDNIRWGAEVDPLETPPASAWPGPKIIPDGLPMLEGEARIDKVSLTFFALPAPAPDDVNVPDQAYRLVLPAYQFEGRTPDGDAFVIYVQAYDAPNG